MALVERGNWRMARATRTWVRAVDDLDLAGVGQPRRARQGAPGGPAAAVVELADEHQQLVGAGGEAGRQLDDLGFQPLDGLVGAGRPAPAGAPGGWAERLGAGLAFGGGRGHGVTSLG
jgi:hypothetical protein